MRGIAREKLMTPLFLSWFARSLVTRLTLRASTRGILPMASTRPIESLGVGLHAVDSGESSGYASLGLRAGPQPRVHGLTGTAELPQRRAMGREVAR
jgi:hypothetical protein